VLARPAMLEIAAADTSLPALQEQLLSAHLLGIRTVLVDDHALCPPTLPAAPGTDALRLIGAIAQLNQGRDIAGSRLDEPTDFTIGVRLPPWTAAEPPGQALDAPYAAAGAHFATLPPVYDAAVFRRIMAAPAASLPLFAEILLLPDAATADELDNEVPALSVPQRLKDLLAADPEEDARGVLRFLAHWRDRLAGVMLMLPDARTASAERVIAGVRDLAAR
jgi:5,10-methylenetetrahydrofolate reductase